MSPYRTHLTILEDTATLHPSANAFRIPYLNPDTNTIEKYQSVTYGQFLEDVEYVAKYWLQTLTSEDVESRSVVGLWLSGLTYVDALHIYGLARAGYIPQLISLRLPSPDVIWELLKISNGKALIFDSSYSPLLRHSHLPMHVAVDARQCSVAGVTLPPHCENVRGDDTIMIFHTSGSTSGRPKLVPCSYAWWSTTLDKAGKIMKPKNPTRGRQDVTVAMGSLCHMGQSFMLGGAIQHGSCMVQFTKQAYSSSELRDMISLCGLTRMNIFPTFLSAHFETSRTDSNFLAQLQDLDEILISGLTMSQEDQQWVLSNGLRVLDCYASTEVAVMMLSIEKQNHGRLPPLQPVKGVSYSFVPIAPSTPESESGYHNLHSRLLELVVLAESPDCPDASLRHTDGNYHTGDLFLEVSPNNFVFCGRDDDWIKTQSSLRCDTKAIEDNVLMTCDNLVSNCVVVGTGRPSPALFVEAAAQVEADKLKKEIFRRIRPFHSRRYLHERIVSEKFIVVVPPNTLPRTATKGNIRRRAVEQAFRAELDCMHRDS